MKSLISIFPFKKLNVFQIIKDFMFVLTKYADKKIHLYVSPKNVYV